ncbi:hypothetical protein [Kitasatospora sp. NPDC006786]|uniref:hypothetical protein n=1 Tax=unclassified Kitasatospora TaxID=2633591 RepID=UPI0033E70C82
MGIAIPAAAAISEAVLHAIDLPADVDVDELVVRPRDDGLGHTPWQEDGREFVWSILAGPRATRVGRSR